MKAAQIIGSQITHLDSVDSTNNYAIGSAGTSNFVDGSIIVAKEQYSGKGLAKNRWESEKAKNLTFSIILYPAFLDPSRQFMLNKSIAIGVHDYLHKLLPNQNVYIKWPNDIYINEGKVAGILINNAIMGSRYKYAVIGIGLNINQQEFHSDAPNPVSLIHYLKKEKNPVNCLHELLPHLNRRYHQLRDSQHDQLDQAYLKNLYRMGIWSEFISNGKHFRGKITGVSEYGQLQIQTQSGNTKEYGFKEVKFD